MIRTKRNKRGALVITDDRYKPSDVTENTLEFQFEDYKGDLPLNPSPWLKVTCVETKTRSDGFKQTRTYSVTLNSEQRATFLAYLALDHRND